MRVVTIAPTPAEQEDIHSLARELSAELRGADEAHAYDRAFSAGAGLVGLSSIRRLAENISSEQPPNAIVFDLGTPEDSEIGPTPTAIVGPEDFAGLSPHTLSRALLLGTVGLHALGKTTQQLGRITNDVAPLPGHEATPQYSSAPGALGFHTEDSYFAVGDEIGDGTHLDGIASDWLTLHFLRNHGRIGTEIATIDPSALPVSTVRELEKPQFPIHTSISHGSTGIVTRAPMFAHDSRGRLLRAHLAFTDLSGLSVQAHDAYDLFDQSIERTVLSAAPGTVAFINNRSTMHGRPPATSGFSIDGTGRWQQRVDTRHDLPELPHYTARPRVIDPMLFLRSNPGIVVQDRRVA